MADVLSNVDSFEVRLCCDISPQLNVDEQIILAVSPFAMLPALLGDFEKTFIIRGFAERCRTDGRELVNHRNFRLIISGKVIAHFSGMNLGSYEEKQPIRLSTQSTQQGSTIEVEDVTSTSSKRRSERFGNSVDISPLGGEIKKAKRHEISYEAVRRHYGDGDVGSYEEKPPSRLPHKVHNPVPLWRRKRLLPRPTKGDQNALDLRSLMKPCAAWPLVCVCTECPRQPRARRSVVLEARRRSIAGRRDIRSTSIVC
ncbi:hypothetical protein KIN20_008217 [Parelaphostrongylus tenuis]|uniref:Uncharacterized protein n=1 Tax=Parelaphostrongylus tenuis TaxID=148309 RepID=A0AAD5QKI1_PARTN|nr:hypothetical protein KIN20_008217 [Parelaphostrongylus tenuis]